MVCMLIGRGVMRQVCGTLTEHGAMLNAINASNDDISLGSVR